MELRLIIWDNETVQTDRHDLLQLVSQKLKEIRNWTERQIIIAQIVDAHCCKMQHIKCSN